MIQPTQGGDLRGPLSWALNLGARSCHASASSLPHHHRYIEHQALRDLRDDEVQRTKGLRYLGKDVPNGTNLGWS